MNRGFATLMVPSQFAEQFGFGEHTTLGEILAAMPAEEDPGLAQLASCLRAGAAEAPSQDLAEELIVLAGEVHQ